MNLGIVVLVDEGTDLPVLVVRDLPFHVVHLKLVDYAQVTLTATYLSTARQEWQFLGSLIRTKLSHPTVSWA